jgi:hypothetical protein
LNLCLLPSSSTRRSLTLGALTSTAPAPQDDLALSGMAVTDDQGATVIVALAAPRGFEVFPYFGLQRLSEHPLRSSSGDLVEIEGDFFAELLAVV